MFNEKQIFIKNAMFFQTNYLKRKPVFVNGRNFFSLTYRHSGDISITCNGKTYHSFTDCITFIPKNTPYTTEVLSCGKMSVIHFDCDGIGMPEQPIVLPTEHSALRALFHSLTAKNKDMDSTFSRMSIFYEILSQFNQLNALQTEKIIPQKIIQAKKEIDQVFNDAYFSIEQLAEKLQISPSYLRRAFRAAYQISPIQHLKETRLNAAKQLLLTQTDSVAKIAEKCGYTSLSYFIQDFHKFVGESPAQYRTRLCI